MTWFRSQWRCNTLVVMKCCAALSVKEDTWVWTIVDSPRDDRRRCSLSMTGQGQTLSFVQGYISWQLLEGRPHVDGQANVLSHRACCVGGHTCENTSISWLCEESSQNWLLYYLLLERDVVHNAVKDMHCTSALSIMSSPDRRTVNLPGRLGTMVPSFSHDTLGSGEPCAAHGSNAWNPWMTDSSVCAGRIIGGTEM